MPEKEDSNQFQQEFLNRVDWGSLVPKAAMNLKHNLNFWIKDSEGRFVVVNENVRRKHGSETVNEAIGKNDYDFSDKNLADAYIADDNKVMQTGNPVVDRIEMVPRPDGSVGWYSTTKYPIFDKENNVIGSFGFSADVKNLYDNVNPIMKMVPVINFIKSNIEKKMDLSFLASITQMSENEFDTKFKKIFSMNVMDYITKCRVEAAQIMLGKSQQTVDSVATKCGFDTIEEYSEALEKFGKKKI